MDYQLARANAVRNAYAGIVQEFVKRYRRGRPTVVVLPGGMGSQLDRSPQPHDGSPPNFQLYDPVWMDIGILFEGDGLKLEIDAQDRDHDAHIIVPNGPLRFVIKAYDGTEAWAAAQNYNYVVFGYDWRRPIEEAAGYLEYFLNLLRESVFRNHNENPLPRTTLFAHSQGGLVAKVFLHRVVDVGSWLERLVTAGTPFYGTATHMDRYYAGQEPLNTLHGPERVARIIGTLPGPYALLYIDQQTFARDWQALGFATANDYPMRDAATGLPLDPYAAANIGRYPPWMNRDHLERARRIRATVALPLPQAAIDRVYNLRTAQNAATPTQQSWAMPHAGNPMQSPVHTASTAGGGDGTVPAWSAILAQTPAANRFDLAQVSEHMDLMEHVEVLNLVGGLIDAGYQPVAATDPAGLFGRASSRASPAEVQGFAADVASSRANRDDRRVHDPRMWRGIAQQLKH